MSDRKEWVTVKLPKDIRDAARDDPRTYGEIMQAGLEDAPTPNAEIPEGVVREALYDALDGVEVGAPDVSDRLERIEAMTQEATNAAQSADRKLDDMGGNR